MRRGTIGGLILLLLAATAGFAQEPEEQYDRYEAQFGTPVDVSLADLVQNPMPYSGRAVRTSGRLDLSTAMQSRRTYILSDSIMNNALLQPVPEIAQEFESEATRFLGRETSVTGV